MLKGPTLSIAIVALLNGGCAATDLEHRFDGGMGVSEVIEGRASLKNQRVVVRGFLSRDGRFYFLSAGALRDDGVLGSGGERSWCTTPRPEPRMIWFSTSEVRRGRGSITDDISRGRLVVVSGILEDETPVANPSEINLYRVTARQLSETSVGPLRDVVIVRLLDEYCLGGSPH